MYTYIPIGLSIATAVVSSAQHGISVHCIQTIDTYTVVYVLLCSTIDTLSVGGTVA